MFSTITKPQEFSSYSQIKITMNDKWVVEPGVRLNYYDTNNKQFYPNLRLGLKYIIKTDEFINLSLGNYNQFLFTFQDDFNPPLLDAWIAIDRSVDDGRAEHFVFGYEKIYHHSLMRVYLLEQLSFQKYLLLFFFHFFYDSLIPRQILWIDLQMAWSHMPPVAILQGRNYLLHRQKFLIYFLRF